MSGPPVETFTRQVRRLSPDERRDFVAAIWAAQGWETSRDGEVIEIRRAGQSKSVAVDVPPERVDPEVDVVVHIAEHGRTQRWIAGRIPLLGSHLQFGSLRRWVESKKLMAKPEDTPVDPDDVSHLETDDLYERLLYGLDRPDAARLSREHLGTDVTGGVGAASRNAATVSDGMMDESRLSLGATPRRTILVVSVALLAVLAGGVLVVAVSGAGVVDILPSQAVDGLDSVAESAGLHPITSDGVSDGNETLSGSERDGEDGPGSVEADAGGDDEAEAGLQGTLGLTEPPPPGIFLTEVHDPARVAAEHAARIERRSALEFQLVVTGPFDPIGTGNESGKTSSDADAHQPDLGINGTGHLTIFVAGDTEYYAVESANTTILNDSAHGSTTALYADGNSEYERTDEGNSVSYSAVDVGETENGSRIAGEAATVPIRVLLNGSESEVEVAGSSPPLYRVTVTGEPSEIGTDVSNFSTVAFITSDGIVVSLRSEFVHEASGETVTIQVRHNLDSESELDAPSWYDEARDETDEAGG